MLLHSEEYRVRRDLLAALLRTANGIVLNEKVPCLPAPTTAHVLLGARLCRGRTRSTAACCTLSWRATTRSGGWSLCRRGGAWRPPPAPPHPADPGDRSAECPSAEALVVPTVVDGGGSVKSTYFVLHPDAARAARHEFARVLARQFPEKVASAAELAAAADELAAHALDATLARVLDAKRSVSVDVTFADAITP